MSGGAPGRVHVVRDQMLLGRDPEAHITLDGSDVSRHHAQILLCPDGGAELLDLGSRNGTLVNGVRVQRQRLEAGDRIRLGAAVFVVGQDDEARASVRPEAVGAVASRVVHELNNAFTALAHDLFYVDALPGTTNLTDHELRACLQEMQEVVRRASGLGAQLLDVGRPGAVVVPVAHLLDEAGRFVRWAIGVGVRVDLPVGEQLLVRGERGPMLEVLCDLCTGASVQGGQLTLRGTARAVGEAEVDALGVAGPGDHVEITVVAGAGDDPPRMLLPRIPESEAPEPRTTTQKIFRPGANAAELLVVDGDREVRAGLRRALRRLGVTVREAAQGSAALAQLHHHPEVGAVIVDLDLGDLSAAELVARIRSTGRSLTILVTAGREDAARAAATGADDFLIKPFDPDGLWAYLNAAR